MTLEEIDAELARRQSQSMRDAAFANGGRLSVEDIDAEIERRRVAEQRQQRMPQARQQAGQAAAQRQLQRSMVPLGLGNITQPIANMIGDPARRRELGNSARGFMRDVQSIPSLDLGRVGRETWQGVTQGVGNLGREIQEDPLRVAGNVAGAIPQVAAEATYRPFQREEQSQQQLDLARLLGDDTAAPARAANAATGQAVINVAAPILGAGGSVARAAVVGGAATAPMALSGPGTLQERLPRAIPQIAAGAGLGGAFQGIANAAPRIAPPRTGRMVDRMERAGVDPSLAAANGGGISGAATKLVGDNWVAGVNVRPRVERQLTQARDAAMRISQGYGRARSPEGAGRFAQAGVQRFAREGGLPNPRPGTDPMQVSTRDWSVRSKADAVFDHVLRPIEANPAQLTSTNAALGQIAQQADSRLVREFQADPVLRDFQNRVQRLGRSGNPPTLRDIRELRRKIRQAQDAPSISSPTREAGALARIEQALTEDMYAAAGPQAGGLRQADAFYRRHMERINDVLRQIDPERIDPTAAFGQIVRWANRKSGDTRSLATLRTALPDSEWRTISASVVEEMGRPTPGAAGLTAQRGFSIENFATAYRAMSPQARRILFGSRGGQGGAGAAQMRQLADELDNLAIVADGLKGVERSANFSGSGRDIQNILGVSGIMTNAPVAIGSVLFLGLTGELLTNPAFVRWLTSAARAGQRPGGLRGSMRALMQIAGNDPAVAAYAADLSQRAPDAAGDPAGRPQQRAPALQ